MNDIAESEIPSRELPFPQGFAVSWAGPHPFQDGYCLGSEEGLLQLFDADFRPLGEPIKGSSSKEAINSVVGCGDWIVASTRQEVSFLAKNSINGQRLGMKTTVGAHCLAVLSNGYVVAALGRLGLMFARPGSASQDSFIIGDSLADANLNVYRVAAIPDSGVVCAARSGGIVFGQWAPTGPQLKAQNFAGFDAVDVCWIGTERHPSAVAVIAKDGTLVMSKEILHDPNPRTMKFASVKGVVYRMVSCRGHLFVLTNKVLYGLAGVAQQFLDGTLDDNDGCRILVLPMKAVDMNLVQGRLIIVELDRICAIDVETIEKDMPGERAERPQACSPSWNSRGVEHVTRELAVA